MFWRLFLVTFIVAQLQFYDPHNADKRDWIQLCRNDYETCAVCFTVDDECTHFLQTTFVQSSIGSSVNKIFGSRQIQYGVHYVNNSGNENRPIVLKHLINDEMLDRLKSDICTATSSNCVDIWKNVELVPKLVELLKEWFKGNNSLHGLKLYPVEAVERFVAVLSSSSEENPAHAFMLANLNTDPILLPKLYGLDFPGLYKITKQLLLPDA